ncbi:unnamed protein product [Parascedosporium putredinis]|uniref:Uncharacterized protein n=1 Tax=Parascedosporium putredinis TaxID=1442378 RepID=A0A9P1H5E5_9PEZI|nr:unnamed protein product [Parascedosporium putredinis]CAI7999296.1 unnamed protein product [Parascedosporium putredinis]
MVRPCQRCAKETAYVSCRSPKRSRRSEYGGKGQTSSSREPTFHSQSVSQHGPATHDDLAMAELLICGRPNHVPLRQLHPSVPQIMFLWNTFLSNVDPLVKLFHAPTVQDMISQATMKLDALSQPAEALMFAIYLCAVMTMNEQQCLRGLETSKETLLKRFSNATQQALVNAKFLQYPDAVNLQALTLYLVLLINEWSGKYSEEAPSGTRAPSNCNDGDLSPFTVRIPDVTEGGTDMLFCTLHNRFRALEATMDSLTCRCDPSIPLHLFTVLIGRYTIARLRFSVRANEAFADHVDLASMPGETRGILLDNALAVLRFDTEMRMTQAIRPFLWHPVARFPFDAFAYLLASLCAGVEGPRHNAAWAAVNSAYEECPEFCSQLDNPLYSAAADLAVGAWERRVAGMQKEAAAAAAATTTTTDEAQGLGCCEMEPPGSTEFSAARHAISALKQARRRRGGEGALLRRRMGRSTGM